VGGGGGGGGQKKCHVNWAWRIHVASNHLLPQIYEINIICRWIFFLDWMERNENFQRNVAVRYVGERRYGRGEGS